jgi:error-prone DNA polymerase
LKAHYPQQFYCSLFNNHHGMYPLRVYVWDAKRHGIKVLPPHVNYSDIEWRLQGRAIRAGLGIIKALSHNSAKAIVGERAIRPFSDLNDLARRIRFRKPELQNLIHVGACDGLAPGDAQLTLFRDPADNVQLPIVRVPLAPSPRRVNPDQGWPSHCQSRSGMAEPLHRASRLKAELDVTGIPFSWHPALLLRIRCVPAARLGGFIGRKVTVAGFIATARRARTNDGRVMGFVTLEDSTGLAEVSFFPDQIQLYRSICSSAGPVWAKGKVTEHLSSITLECSDCGEAA